MGLTSARGTTRLWSGFIAAQTALTLVLLFGGSVGLLTLGPGRLGRIRRRRGGQGRRALPHRGVDLGRREDAAGRVDAAFLGSLY